jgi:hypothetical protein
VCMHGALVSVALSCMLTLLALAPCVCNNVVVLPSAVGCCQNFASNFGLRYSHPEACTLAKHSPFKDSYVVSYWVDAVFDLFPTSDLEPTTHRSSSFEGAN